MASHAGLSSTVPLVGRPLHHPVDSLSLRSIALRGSGRPEATPNIIA